MFKSLYSKIAVGLAFLFLVVGLLFIGITVFSTDMYQQEVNQKLNTDLARQIVKERLLIKDGQVDQGALKNIFHMLMVVNPGIEIYLLDIKGKILTYSAPQGSVKLKAVSLEPIKKYLNEPLRHPFLGDDPKNLNRKKVFSVAPVIRDSQLEGYLYVILGGEQYDSVVQKLKGSYILQLSAWMIFAGLLFAMIAGLVLFALLTGRLKRLASVMDAFKRGDSFETLKFPLQKSRRSQDEIDLLSSTFKEMADQIDSQMVALKSSDKMRRELVANVSHDLRTPLATLQGYIETLLIKEDQYSDAERRQYLEIAITHCQRLNKLVNELLELAKLESPEMKVHIEPFNLLELTQDILQKFTLIAEKSNIKMETQFISPIPFALADISLIERVLENLIENALHYTPENGRIDIQIKHETDIILEISDTGPGIPNHEIPHIFKRFYQSEKGRKGGKTHSGLGLAITKKIIELHQKEISVTANKSKGTTFVIHLPAKV